MSDGNDGAREACGRCAMTTVVDATAGGERDGERGARDPYACDRIEVSDHEARLVSPAAWLAGLRSRLDGVASRLVYGR